MVKIQYNKKTKEWITLPKYSRDGVYYDGYLLEKILNIIKIQKKGYDSIIIIDGDRRSGKSTLAMTIGYRICPDLSIKNFVSGLRDAVAKLESLPDESVAIFDEGSLSFSSKDALNKEQKQLLKIIDIIGQKKLTIIIVLPSFFDLIRPIAIPHSRFLLHVYTDEQLNRGRFAYFGTDSKKYLYEIGKKRFGSYTKPEADFIGTFENFEPVYYRQYLNLKKKSLNEALSGEDVKFNPARKVQFIKECLRRVEKERKEHKRKPLGSLFGCTPHQIDAYRREIRAIP